MSLQLHHSPGRPWVEHTVHSSITMEFFNGVMVEELDGAVGEGADDSRAA